MDRKLEMLQVTKDFSGLGTEPLVFRILISIGSLELVTILFETLDDCSFRGLIFIHLAV